MRHRRANKKLGMKSAHRMAALRSLSTSLFDKERIRTTLPKAKALRPFAEKLITLSKREDLHARRRVARVIQDPKVVKKLFDTLSPRYIDRPGGYMRIMRLGRRQGDGAELAMVELVGSELVIEKEPEKKTVGQRVAARIRGRKKDKTEPEPDEAGDSSPAEEEDTKSGS